MIARYGWTIFLTALPAGSGVEALRLEVPVYREVRTHIHRPEDLKPGEKRPAVLFIGEPGCKMARHLSRTRRFITTHFTPAEDITWYFLMKRASLLISAMSGFWPAYLSS